LGQIGYIFIYTAQVRLTCSSLSYLSLCHMLSLTYVFAGSE